MLPVRQAAGASLPLSLCGSVLWATHVRAQPGAAQACDSVIPCATLLGFTMRLHTSAWTHIG